MNGRCRFFRFLYTEYQDFSEGLDFVIFMNGRSRMEVLDYVIFMNGSSICLQFL